MSKPSKTPEEYKKWSDDLTAMRRRNRDQVAAMKEYKAIEAKKKRLEAEIKEIKEHEKRVKETIEKAHAADAAAAAANKHGGRRHTRRR